ncbi:unnamed protein product, partial [Ilex paraguariensis]
MGYIPVGEDGVVVLEHLARYCRRGDHNAYFRNLAGVYGSDHRSEPCWRSRSGAPGQGTGGFRPLEGLADPAAK